MTRQSIREHEGNKYIRMINPAIWEEGVNPRTVHRPIPIDVYCVLNAFPTGCPATDHAIKKLLCAGIRGKGSRLADLKGAMAALNRAIDEEEAKDKYSTHPQFFTPTGTTTTKEAPKTEGEWEVFIEAGPDVIGSRVRWSVPDSDGRYLWVRHYLTDEEDDSPSLGWCRDAAERDAERFNKEGRRPEEWDAFSTVERIREENRV